MPKSVLLLQYLRSNSGIRVFLYELSNNFQALQAWIDFESKTKRYWINSYCHNSRWITIGAQSKENSCILKDSYVIKMLQNVIKTFKKHFEKLVSRKALLLHLV